MEPQCNEDQQREAYQAYLNDYLKRVFLPHFPKQYFSETTCIGGLTNWHQQPIPRLANQYGRLRGSKYFMEPAGKKFIHYTSLENLYSMLNEGGIRMFDANAMSDKRECLRGADLMPLYAPAAGKQLQQLKALLYLFSFNSYETGEESLTMWRTYGRDGNGCALVFSLEGDFEYWQDTVLSPIYYNKSDLAHFDEMSRAHEKFLNGAIQIKSNLYPGSEGRMPDEMVKFLAFHKEPIYHEEKEIRLIRYIPSGRHQDTRFGHSLNRSFEKITYVTLPFKKGNDSYGARGPVVNLEKVILGYNYKPEQLLKKQVNFTDLFAYTLEKRVEVTASALAHLV